MRKRLITIVVAGAALGVAPAAAQDVPGDFQPPSVDCVAKPKKTYSLRALLRAGAVTVPARCDGATRMIVNFEVRAPIEATINTPKFGVPDATGDATFTSAGTKGVRVRLHKRTARAIKGFDWIRVGLTVAVEMPDQPGSYYGEPDDYRKVFFRR